MISIFVNGQEIRTSEGPISYKDVILLEQLPYRGDYTVTWKTKTDKGILRLGGNSVIMSEGMRFTVSLTGDA